jgi:O-acetyl-ADP-ribose deacetylase (regulator of RNase III)
MIKYHSGDLFLAPIDLAGHCANCQHTFGSGIARAIRELYPEVYEADCKESKKNDPEKMGTITWATLKQPKAQLKHIANLYGQFTFGGIRDVNYEAIYKALVKFRWFAEQLGVKTVGFPYRMASDRAGGDWLVIESMIWSVFKDSGIDVLICQRPEDKDDYESPFELQSRVKKIKSEITNKDLEPEFPPNQSDFETK